MRDNTRFYYKKNRLQQIRGFCATVQSGCSIRRASVMLGIEHSAISLQIRSLEEDLKTKLFKRCKNNKMILTKDGDLFYKKAIIHLQGIDSLFDYFNSNLEKYADNDINIACDNLTATYVLPKYLSFFKEVTDDFDNLKINIDITTLENSFEKLINNNVDLALFCYFPSINVPVEIQEENISTYDNFFISSEDYIRSSRRELPIRLPKNNSPDCFIIDNPNINIGNGNLTILKNFTKYGLLTCIAPDIILNEDDCKNFNINKDCLFLKTYFSIFYVKNYIKKNSIKKFILNIKENSIIKDVDNL